jgi:branched-chain amino acid transport system permease protein
MLNLVGVVFDGAAYGMLLFLLAVGLSITMGLMGFVNLAHAAFAMVSGYALVGLSNQFGWPFGVAVLGAAVASGAIGLVMESLLYRRLYRARPLQQVLMTVGLVFVATSIATFAYGPGQQIVNVPPALRGQVAIGAFELSRYRLLVIGVGLALAALVVFSLERTRVGAQVRAAVDNQLVASTMGVRVHVLFRLVFAAGCALAGVGGALGVEVFGLDPSFPIKYLVYCLLVVVVGGTGSVVGTLYAALLVGIADVAGKYYVPQAGAFVVYTLMIVLLLAFPRGLKGKPA